jgi:hypothetical protein
MTQAETDRSKPEVQRFDRAAPRHPSSGEDNVQWVKLNPRAVARVLACVIAGIVVFGALANYAVYNLAPHPDHPLADVLKRFDLGHEPSIPAFYSSTVMLASSALLVFLGRFDQSAGGSRKRYWYALGLLFLCLAIDEIVMFHEMGTAAMDRLNLSGPFYFSWIVPGMVFAAVVGMLFLRFILAHQSRTRNLFILSGIVFLAGAIGMEFIAGLIFGAAESEEAASASVSHVLVQAVEEGLEMTGVAIFLCALIDYVNLAGLAIHVRDNSSSQVATDE